MVEAVGAHGRTRATLRAEPGVLVVALAGEPEMRVPLGQGGVTEAVVTPNGLAGADAVELRDGTGRAVLVLSRDAWPAAAVDEVLATAGIRRRAYTRTATRADVGPVVLWPDRSGARDPATAADQRDVRLQRAQMLATLPAGVVALVGAVRARTNDDFGPGSDVWPTDGWLLAASLLTAAAAVFGLLRLRVARGRYDVMVSTGQSGLVALVLLGVGLFREAVLPSVVAGVVAVVAVGVGLNGWWRIRALGKARAGE